MAEIEIGTNLLVVLSLLVNGILAIITLQYRKKCKHLENGNNETN